MQLITKLEKPIYFLSAAAVGGKEESQTKFANKFDFLSDDDLFGMKSYERAEGEMSRIALNMALKKAPLEHTELNLIVAGDLQNQCIASSSGLFSFGVPYLGLYGACSTFTESLIVAASLMSVSEKYNYAATVSSSHNSTAERQFRNPLEYASGRSPTSQWTATAAGAFILTKNKSSAGITGFMPGRVIDGYTKDSTNMGAAMALSASDTILSFFKEEDISEYDLILTGDLGIVGSAILCELIEEKGSRSLRGFSEKHKDCGVLLYDTENGDYHSGGSGCGCSASLMAASFLPNIIEGKYKRALLLSTGALMSKSSVFQGEHIMGITPLVIIENFS